MLKKSSRATIRASQFFRNGCPLMASAVLASGCANTPPASQITDAQRAAAVLESVADSHCPNAAPNIHAEAGQLREYLQAGEYDVATLTLQKLTRLSDLCKIEETACGVGPHKPPRIGMKESEIGCTFWGFPDKKNITETAGHFRQQWVYPHGHLYLDNGVLTAVSVTH